LTHGYVNNAIIVTGQCFYADETRLTEF
jgi:hypothetical protein